ncbi:MAG: hypothetical protein KBC90_14220 [Spirochaetes bacterium]|nr:hypothetical protein [Spirochaetota bacterium]HOD16592.1 hypothetical protein [Spirochaetota bacterium]
MIKLIYKVLIILFILSINACSKKKYAIHDNLIQKYGILYGDSFEEVGNWIGINNKSEFLIIGQKYITKKSTWLIKLDNNYQITWDKIINQPNDFSITNAINFNDKIFAVGSAFIDNEYDNWALLIFDDNGKIFYKKYFDHTNTSYKYSNHEYANFISQMPNNSFLVGGTTYIDLNNREDKDENEEYEINQWYGWISNISHDGKLYWHHSYQANNILSIDSIINTKNEIFVLAESVNELRNLNISLFTIGNNGKIIWRNDFDYSNYDEPVSLLLTKNADIYILASIKFINKNIQKIKIIKFDNNKNKIWENDYGVDSYYYNPNCFIETYDNNLIIIGTRKECSYTFDNTNAKQLLIFMIDSNGNKLWEKLYSNDSFDVEIKNV